MPKALSPGLRKPIAAAVMEGETVRWAALRFEVSAAGAVLLGWGKAGGLAGAWRPASAASLQRGFLRGFCCSAAGEAGREA